VANDYHTLHLPTQHHLSQVPREGAVRMQGLRVAVVHRPRSKGRRRTPLRDARANDDEFHNAQTTGQKGRNVNDYRDCPKCEKLKDENQKLQQTQNELQTKLRSIKRRNAAAFIPALIGVGVFMVLSSIVHGVVTAPKEPPKPIQCADSAEVISSDDSMRHCSPGAKLTVTPLQVADKVLVRCECGTNAVKDDGQ